MNTDVGHLKMGLSSDYKSWYCVVILPFVGARYAISAKVVVMIRIMWREFFCTGFYLWILLTNSREHPSAIPL